MDQNPEVISWNPRGLNNPAKRDSVREVIDSLHVNVVCFQETKMDVIDRFIVNQCLGPSFDSFDYLPAEETHGGILLAWNMSMVRITNVVKDSFAISGEVHTGTGEPWWITIVYGPLRTEDKVQFLAELTARKNLCPGAWMIIGDFNMILRASEKSNDNLDRASMRRFRDFVSNLELKECYMHGRLFTWSNERRRPTMSKIDRALVSVDWDLAYPDSLLQAISSSVSDHAPLHLSMNAAHRPVKRFQFESFWLNLEGFDDAVREGWQCAGTIVDPFHRLDSCFRNLAKHLQSWGDKRVGNLKMQIALANLIIHRFDAAQELRDLSPEEWWLRRSLKQAVLGMSSLERTMARQRSRMRWLKDGDANTKLFHAVANGRRVKNFIPAIRHAGELITDQQRKEAVFFDSYNELLGKIQNREHTINLDMLDIQEHDLQDLGALFTEEEVWGIIKEMPSDKAPGPDGFIGAFYKRAWPTIKPEIMAAVTKLYVGDGRAFGRLNRALITLVPKKQGAEEVGDFRPISLVHSFAKLFSKLIANRLRPRMESLVSANQSAFIKGRN
jgi:exonuclease III